MAHDVELSCRCGEIHGWLRGVSPRTVNRAICYCVDCQAFLHYLGRADLFDAHAGTELVQAAPRCVTFDRGAERISGVRLAPKGLYRWYASCCRTPLGNTKTPALPFIGMAPEVFKDAADAARRDALFGKVRGAVFGQHATNGVPAGSTRPSLALLAHSVRLLLGWKLRGEAWPHPFFDRATGAPNRPAPTLAPEELSALLAKCGPHPQAQA